MVWKSNYLLVSDAVSRGTLSQFWRAKKCRGASHHVVNYLFSAGWTLGLDKYIHVKLSYLNKIILNILALF